MVRLHLFIQFQQGLDYPGIGPEHADLYDKGRAEYVANHR